MKNALRIIKALINNWQKQKTLNELIAIKSKLSHTYALSAWMLAGLVMYKLLKQSVPEDKDELLKTLTANIPGTFDVDTYKIKGSQVVEHTTSVLESEKSKNEKQKKNQ